MSVKRRIFLLSDSLLCPKDPFDQGFVCSQLGLGLTQKYLSRGKLESSKRAYLSGTCLDANQLIRLILRQEGVRSKSDDRLKKIS